MCDCRTKVDEKLVDHNARIAISFELSDGDGPTRGMVLAPPSIEVEKIYKKKRGKPPILMANYCPFCGTKYQ